eukprot:augustus_masked-scaffold_24-processed-gene-0.3-mRNA-1 protein AED:0.26 eAED:0.27 QI:0/-1/0/1/-1/1/1/0/1347
MFSYSPLLCLLPLLLNAQEIQKEEHILRSATIETLQENETAHFFLETDTSKFSCRNLLTVSYSLGDFCSFDENLRVEIHENGDFTVLDVADSLCGGFGGSGRQLRTSRQYVSEDKSCFVTYNEDGFHGAMTLRNKQTQKVSLVSFEQVACSFDNELDCVELVTTGGEEFISRNLQGVVEDDLSPFYLERADDSCYEEITSSLPNKMFFGITTTTGFSSFFSDDTQLILQHIDKLIATANLVFIQQLNFRLVVSHITILLENPDFIGAVKPAQASSNSYSNSVVRNLQEDSIWTNRDFSGFNSDSQFTCSVSTVKFNAFNDQAPQRLVSSWILLAGFCQGFAGLASKPGICQTSGTVGSAYVPLFSTFYAYNFIHEVGHLFGSSHYSELGVMQASGVSLREGETQFPPSALNEICTTLESKIHFCERTDIEGLRAVEMFPGSDGSGFMDGGLDAGCECDPRNECCRVDCTLADSSVTCSTESGSGYCRNGACEGANEMCMLFLSGIVDYCGVEDDNPCQGKCSQTSGGVTTCSTHFSAEIKDGTKCSVAGEDGLCSLGSCLIFENPSGGGLPPTNAPTETSTSSPSNLPTNLPTPNPTRSPTKSTRSPTLRPSASPSTSPSQAPTRSPSTGPTLKPTLHPSHSPTIRPTLSPTNSPSPHPTRNPSVSPSSSPTIRPTRKPSASPTLNPTLHPSISPTQFPTRFPSRQPSISPTVNPSSQPTDSPSESPSLSPTFSPSGAPSLRPTASPTNEPSISPSVTPSFHPTVSPSVSPTVSPSVSSTVAPTLKPSASPTFSPTLGPSIAPSVRPTFHPTLQPTISPSVQPSISPSFSPTGAPTARPTASPTLSPTSGPSVSPSEGITNRPTGSPTSNPTFKPSISPSLTPSTSPSVFPTSSPTNFPTGSPSSSPTESPTHAPSKSPVVAQTANPTTSPSNAPTNTPTPQPTNRPSASPTSSPSNHPTSAPTKSPTKFPTSSPTLNPTQFPSSQPTISPTEAQTITTSLPTVSPTLSPTNSPIRTNRPTQQPTETPTKKPSFSPSQSPTQAPSNSPTVIPTNQPSEVPTSSPSLHPTLKPTNLPTQLPSTGPSFSPSQAPTEAPTDPTASPSTSPTPIFFTPLTTIPTSSPTSGELGNGTSEGTSSNGIPGEDNGMGGALVVLGVAAATTPFVLLAATRYTEKRKHEKNTRLSWLRQKSLANDDIPGLPLEGQRQRQATVFSRASAMRLPSVMRRKNDTPNFPDEESELEDDLIHFQGQTPANRGFLTRVSSMRVPSVRRNGRNNVDFSEEMSSDEVKNHYRGKGPTKAPLLSRYSSPRLPSIRRKKKDPFDFPDEIIEMDTETAKRKKEIEDLI